MVSDKQGFLFLYLVGGACI